LLLAVVLGLLPVDATAKRSARTLGIADLSDVIAQTTEANNPQVAKPLMDAAFFHTGEQKSYIFQVDAGDPKKLPGE